MQEFQVGVMVTQPNPSKRKKSDADPLGYLDSSLSKVSHTVAVSKGVCFSISRFLPIINKTMGADRQCLTPHLKMLGECHTLHRIHTCLYVEPRLIRQNIMMMIHS